MTRKKMKVQEVDQDKFFIISADIWSDVEGMKCASKKGARKTLKKYIKELEQENEAAGDKDTPIDDYRIYRVELVE